MDRPLHVGFLIPGDGTWNGGINYLRTVLATIKDRAQGRIIATVFVAPQHQEIAQKNFSAHLETPIVVDAHVAGAGKGASALSSLIFGHDKGMAALIHRHKIDVLFENARFFGHRFPVPILSWIPDFQHRHLPHMFGRLAWWKRDLGFRLQCSGSRLVMLSSLTAEQDCRRFYPSAEGHTSVVRFVTSLPLADLAARVQTVRADYGLPDKFFFLPNQFWQHKNHLIVVQALEKLAQDGAIADLPPIVLSGMQADPRNPKLFDAVMGRAQKSGVTDWFRHLGHIPYLDVLALNMASLAVLNPSFFEGWASSVEEAKALQTPLILCDIPVHREQAPTATFFGQNDAAALANSLRQAARLPARVSWDMDAIQAHQDVQLAQFAQDIFATLDLCRTHAAR